MDFQRWFYEAATSQTADRLVSGYESVSQHYNEAANAFAQKRENIMTALDEKAPALAQGVRKVSRSIAIVEKGIQNGLVEIPAGLVKLGGDLVLNNGVKLITGKKLYQGSASDWTRRNLNQFIDKTQEVTSLGLRKPPENLSETEQRVSKVFSLATQLAMPAAAVIKGVSKGHKVMNTARIMRTFNPQQHWLKSLFNDAIDFSSHPIRYAKHALDFGNSSNKSVNLAWQLGEETANLTGLSR